MAKYFCDKCGKEMEEINFYTYKDGRKTELCKKCLTMHIDNYNPETFLWLLEKMDVPYIEPEWNVIREKAYAKDPYSMNGTSVFGKYLSKMKLKQWKDFSWKDTERLQEETNKKAEAMRAEAAERAAIIQERFENGEISEAEYKTLVSSATQRNNPAATQTLVIDNANPYNEDNFIKEAEMPDPAAELTTEDKLMLAMKWGRLYKPAEWIELETDYNNMMNSFDIQDADTENTLILICKTNLKMNQALDCGDVDGFQKLSRVSESLRKSAKFTAAQNKEEKGDFVDSVGALVAYCEKNGGVIPKYDITVDPDIIDKVIDDLKSYTKSLITEDKALARQIEDYLKKREIAEIQKDDLMKAKAMGLDAYELSDEDYEDYFDSINEDQKIDNQENGDED